MSISKLVLGTVQFGLNYGIANQTGKPSFERVKEILARAAELGIRTLDTAAAYGDSEIVLGKALTELGLTDTMQIVTKIRVPAEAGANEMRAAIEASLQRLQRKTLHGVLFHVESEAYRLPTLHSVTSQMNMRCGISLDSLAHPSVECAELIQVPSNILDRRFLNLLRQKHNEGVEIHCRSVYLQGLLLMQEERIPQNLASVIPYRRKLEKLAAESGITPSELYMRYLFSIPEIDGVLTGVDTVEQLENNVAMAAKGPLPADMMAQILQIIPDLPESLIRPSNWS